jgi:hypothetical protein
MRKQEREIRAALQARSIPEADDFPLWPALRLNVERMFDALRNGDLAYALKGLKAPPETPIDHSGLTVVSTP